MRDSPLRWVLAAIAALCIVGLVALARNDAGIDDRDGDPEDVVATETTVEAESSEPTVATETTG